MMNKLKQLHLDATPRLPMAILTWALILIAVRSTNGLSIYAAEGPREKRPKSAMHCLVLDGPSLHASLHTRQMDAKRDSPTGLVSSENPKLSLEKDFVRSVSKAGSQGRLRGTGMRAALFARYSTGNNELGFYGLVAESESHADAREKELRKIWAHNGRHGRSKVYRKNLVLLVVWHDGLPPDCWESVNSVVQRQLRTLDPP